MRCSGKLVYKVFIHYYQVVRFNFDRRIPYESSCANCNVLRVTRQGVKAAEDVVSSNCLLLVKELSLLNTHELRLL